MDEQNNFIQKYGKSFCVLPWLRILIDVNGQCSNCCRHSKVRMESGLPYSLTTSGLMDIWNSKAMCELRRLMVEGKAVPECNSCYEKELNGGSSRRLDANWSYEKTNGFDSIASLKIESEKSNFSLSFAPTEYHIETDNLCNLRCRMCSPRNSSRIQTDGVHRQWCSNIGQRRKTVESTACRHDDSWFKDDSLVEETLFRGGVPKIVAFSGGEPMINPRVIRIVKRLASESTSQEQNVTLVTNGTVINEELLELRHNFRLLSLCVSFDAVGNGGEYIRNGAGRDVVKENILELVNVKKNRLHVMICSTLQAYNALEFCDVLEFCDNNNLINSPNFVYAPKHCSVNALPAAVREVAAERLLEFSKKGGRSSAHAAMLANVIQSNLGKFEPADLHEFMKFTNDLDFSRGQNIKETFPELVRLIEQSGYPWIEETRYWKPGI